MAGAAKAQSAGRIQGRVTLGVEGVPLESVGPLVVYLERLDGAVSGAAPKQVPSVHQHHALFAPPFLVVAAGQSVKIANDDAIYHNVFSYSRPNDFDLGLYPAGESRIVKLLHPGVVKLYCSIHETMNAIILVTPTRWFDTVSASGSYALAGVPPGRYRAVVWAERLPRSAREIQVGAGRTQQLDWVVGSAP